MISRGYLYVICCASSFGIIPTIAKITYDDGTSLEMVVFFRILAGSIFMGVWSAWKVKGKFLEKKMKIFREKNRSISFLFFIVGICVVGMGLGYIGSYKFIPVSLSVLLFFTFPFWVLLLNFFIEGKSIKPLKLIAFILAFFGLSICLGPNWNSLDIRGILLVLLGSFCSAGMIVGALKATKIISMSDLIFFSNTIGAMILGIFLFIYGHFTVSYSLGGWLGIILICILFNIGQLSLFAATKNIGSAQTSIMLNIEPIITISSAIVMLGEKLLLSQILGVAIILTALFLANFELNKFKS